METGSLDDDWVESHFEDFLPDESAAGHTPSDPHSSGHSQPVPELVGLSAPAAATVADMLDAHTEWDWAQINPDLSQIHTTHTAAAVEDIPPVAVVNAGLTHPQPDPYSTGHTSCCASTTAAGLPQSGGGGCDLAEVAVRGSCKRKKLAGGSSSQTSTPPEFNMVELDASLVQSDPSSTDIKPPAGSTGKEIIHFLRKESSPYGKEEDVRPSGRFLWWATKSNRPTLHCCGTHISSARPQPYLLVSPSVPIHLLHCCGRSPPRASFKRPYRCGALRHALAGTTRLRRGRSPPRACSKQPRRCSALYRVLAAAAELRLVAVARALPARSLLQRACVPATLGSDGVRVVGGGEDAGAAHAVGGDLGEVRCSSRGPSGQRQRHSSAPARLGLSGAFDRAASIRPLASS